MKILLADDHPLYREGVKPVLNKLAERVELFDAYDYPSAFNLANQHSDLDLALLDLYMPGMPGLDGIQSFRDTFPQIAMVVLSAADEPEDIQQVLNAGALGYIIKSSSSELMLSALRLVQAGGVYIPSVTLGERSSTPAVPIPVAGVPALTNRQLDVMRQLAHGKSNRQIADTLEVTEGTIKIHLAAIFRILSVSNRTEALLAAQRMGIR